MLHIKKSLLILLALTVVLSGLGLAVDPAQAAPAEVRKVRIPTIEILGTSRDNNVTIQVGTYPDGYVEIFIGPYGSKGMTGYKVGSATVKNRRLKATFAIPPQLFGADRLDIRVQGKARYALATGWFFNMSSASSGYTDNPLLRAKNIVKDTSVTIMAYNMPPSASFEVYFMPITAKNRVFRPDNIDYYKVGTWSTGAGGSLTSTFNIPPQLVGAKSIAFVIHYSPFASHAATWFVNLTR